MSTRIARPSSQAPHDGLVPPSEATEESRLVDAVHRAVETAGPEGRARAQADGERLHGRKWLSVQR